MSLTQQPPKQITLSKKLSGLLGIPQDTNLSMQLPPNPKLKDVSKICKTHKDIDFLCFFDATKSNLYPTVRHRYNQLIEVSANGISHLKLFTKHLKSIIDAQQTSSDECLRIVDQYRAEEPTLKNVSGFVKLTDEAAVKLPSEQKSDVSALHRKTDMDAFSDIFGFERNMANLLVMYWTRLNQEVYQPLYEYRKNAVTKLESIQEYVSVKYDKLIKQATKLREIKVTTIEHWNDLCDARHTLRKARSNAPDSNKTKKQASKVKGLELKAKKHFENTVEMVDKFNKKTTSKVKGLELKAKKHFENTVEMVDKFNNTQDEFWNEVVKDACIQLEAMEYSRICFYQEYFDKYHELLEWRKAELENGENTLARARKMMMTPFEIAEYGIHPIRVDHGNYNPIQPQQYELPCMPEELLTLQGKITEQRIDPAILTPVHNPFGEELKPQTSRHIKTNYSRSATVIYHHNKSNSGLSTLSHDRDTSISSVSLSMSSTIHPPPGLNANRMSAKQLISSQPSGHSFFGRDNTKSKLFSRTNREQQHNGGLPRPDLPSDDESSTEFASPPLGPISPPPQKIPPKKSAFGYPNGNNYPPALPQRGRAGAKSKPGAVKTHLPAVPNRPVPSTVSLKGSATPTTNMGKRPPKLPPRRKTMPNGGPPKKPPPNKSPLDVAKIVRRTTYNGNGPGAHSKHAKNNGNANPSMSSNHSNGSNNSSTSSKSNNSSTSSKQFRQRALPKPNKAPPELDDNKKKKSKWKIGK
eukprot:CAMPEP_0201594596 /NCGR_PEP_ID=MMETSP0190_2-20130828/191862_1 /ASSEMBLY_ACC=CAM_ASM_000263 /TAXON_ID=37353 /ORGANISM="Rosalina sp." /LENGTH=751 /DNA_ID=CAMNT_0048054267 /DNA_START=23 /DNA_END=2282 /DNA_ORIENTATION=+